MASVALTDGKKMTLKVRHGETIRELTGKVRKFEADGAERWELVGVKEVVEYAAVPPSRDDPDGSPAHTERREYEAVGIAPENIIEAVR